jgi:acyl-CoA reductase-like NAD-dependent aldehyde dehydrogenase
VEQLYIGGEYVDSASGRPIEVENPATEEIVTEVPDASADDVDRAVAAARGAQRCGGVSTRSRARTRCTSARGVSRSTPTSSPCC